MTDTKLMSEEELVGALAALDPRRRGIVRMHRAREAIRDHISALAAQLSQANAVSADLKRAQTELDVATTQLTAAREALEPFARAPIPNQIHWQGGVRPYTPSDEEVYPAGPIKYGDLRRAARVHEALSQTSKETK